MANLLTFERMRFLMDKMGASFNDTDVKYNRIHDYVLFDDLSAKTLSNASGKFCFVNSRSIYNYNDRDSDMAFVPIYFYDNGKATHYAIINPKKLLATNAQYPATPLYVGTKRVNQAICKVGGVLKTVQGIYVKQGGNIKKLI